MGAVSIDDIIVTELARITTPGGDVMHALKKDSDGFAGFGEAYFSWVHSGSIKAWKRHNRMTMNMVVPVGQIRVVFYDEASNRFRVEEIGDGRYVRLTVPPGIWFGFQGLASPQSLLTNIANITHDPSEVDRCELTEIKYNWLL
ncbi:MAG: dTDP-4-dehydrorhamnose 3,5-epimerase [Sediminibacterium sp.]